MRSGTCYPPPGPEKRFSLESELEFRKCTTLLRESLWAVLRQLIWGSLWRFLLESFLVHFGGGFGTHSGADLEHLKYPGK